MRAHINRQDILAVLILLGLPLILFWQVTLGPSTLLPVDNLFAHEPWLSYRAAHNVGLPQNQLLSDLILQNYSWKHFIRDSLAEGRIPLWNPYILGGQPFLANGQHSALYPFSILFYLLPLDKAYGWFTVSQLWLAGVSMYIFGRVLGASRIGALAAGVTYALSTFFVVSVVFTMIIAGAVWLPLLLAFIEIIIRKQEIKGPVSYSPIPYIAAGAVTLGVQALAGHVEITYYVLLVSGFYTLCRLIMLWRAQQHFGIVVRLGLWLLLMVILGLGLGAAQLVPMYEVVTQNFRDNSVTLQQVREWALPLRRVATFIIPDFFGSPAHHGYFDVITRQWQPLGLNANGEINPLCPNCTSWDTKTAVEAGAYLGILPLILAGVALWRGVRTTTGPVLIFAALAVISVLFMFGSPLYAILFYGLPGWNQLHSPFRWIYPFTLSMAVLAGLGVTYLEAVPRVWLKRMGWLLAGGGVAGVAVMLAALAVPGPFISAATFVFNRSGLAQNAFADGRQFFGYQWPNFLEFSAVVLASGLVLWLASRHLKAAGFAFVAVIALDLLVAGHDFNPAVDASLLAVEPRVVQWLKQQQESDPLFRLTSFDTPDGPGNKVFLANAGMPHQLYDVRGYDSIIPGHYADFMQTIQPNGDLLFNRVGPLYHDGYAALDSALLDLLGVRYVLTAVEIPNAGYELVYDDEIRVYENLDALPRAFLVPESSTAIELPSLNPRETVRLDDINNGLGRDLTAAARHIPATGGVDIVSYTPNEIIITARVTDSAWLVLADTYFVGWRAYAVEQTAFEQSTRIDETELTIHRANGAFRAVTLPPGEWRIRFRYAPRSVQLGLYGSFLAGVMLVFLGGYWAWYRLYRETDSDSTIKRIAKNSLVPMVMAVSNRIIDFAFALLMLRILQPEGAGRYAFAVAFIGMAEILTRYGLGTLVTREVSARRDDTSMYLSNVSVLRLYLWLAAIPMMAAVLGLYVWFGTTTDVVIAVALLAIGTLLSNFSDGLTAVFYAHEKAEYPAGIASITTLTRVSVGALVLLLGWGIIGLAGASVVANLVAFTMLSYLFVIKIMRPQWQHDPNLQGEMMRESLPLMINHLLSTIFFRIDVFILKPIWGDREVGFYNAAYKYVDGINIIPQYFTLAIFPLMSRFAADSHESLVRAYLLSLRLLLILAIPISMGTPFIAHELILLLAGDSFIPDSVIVLQLLIWFLPFSFINQVTQYVLIAVNQQRHLTRAFVIGVMFNVITNLIFIPWFGYRAAAITTILSEWALLIPFYHLVRQHVCVVPWVDIAWRPTVAAAMMGSVLWWLDDLNVLLTVLSGGGTYISTLFLLGGFHQRDMAVIWRAMRWQRRTAD